jgi:adenylate cyclase
MGRDERTFAFVDLCGFTAYADGHGDERAVEVLEQLRLALTAAAERRGVQISKWLGDGAMISAVDPEALVLCLVEVRDAIATNGPLPLRSGVATGPAIRLEHEDYVGEAVNVAARLCAQATCNQIFATAEVGDVVADCMRLRALPAIRVRGVREPIPIRELLAPRLRQIPAPRGGRAHVLRSRDLVAESLLRRGG